MRGLLNDGTSLDGGAGHMMRVAMAAEAWNMGLSIEEAIEMFRNQPDFDSGITREYVGDIYRRGYKRFSCRKLQDQCSSLVESYCASCPHSD